MNDRTSPKIIASELKATTTTIATTTTTIQSPKASVCFKLTEFEFFMPTYKQRHGLTWMWGPVSFLLMFVYAVV